MTKEKTIKPLEPSEISGTIIDGSLPKWLEYLFLSIAVFLICCILMKAIEKGWQKLI